MGAEQVAPVVGIRIDRPPLKDPLDLRLPRALKSWALFSHSHKGQLDVLGSLQPEDAVLMAGDLSRAIASSISFGLAEAGTPGLDVQRLTGVKDSITGEGNKVIFTRHGEQSPPEWIHSIKDPRLKKIRMMQSPFNQDDLLTNPGLISVFVTAFGVLYLTQATGKNLHVISSENQRARQVAEITCAVVPGTTYTTDEGLTSITYKDERDSPPTTVEEILEELPSGFMPWDPRLIDKWCKPTKSGINHSEAIIRTIGSLMERGMEGRGNDLFLVLTHSQQLAEVLKQKKLLDDPFARFPELTMLTVSQDGVRVFPSGVLSETATKEDKKPKNGMEFTHPFSEVDDHLLEKVGGKGANLVLLQRAGLPVPNGYCVPADAHTAYLENGSLPKELVQEITKAKAALGGKVAIRSSANCEDGLDLSMAGVFNSYYVTEDGDIPKVVEEIYRQSQSEEVAAFMALHGKSAADVKMGLVVQQLIEPDISGVIYTGMKEDEKLIQYVDGFGAKLVDGQTHGSTMMISPGGMVLESTGFETRPLSAKVIKALAKRSATIEALFSGIPQDIEFAIQGDEIHILQARTLTAKLDKVDLQESPQDSLEGVKVKLKRLVEEEKRELGVKTATFSDANYSELLPAPTEMDIGVYMYIWGGSDGVPGAKQLGHAEMGYEVGESGSGIIKYIGGRTYASVARYAAIYHSGFPESRDEYFGILVNEYLEKIQQDPEKGAYPQMGLFLQDPTFEGLQSRFGERAGEYMDVYQSFAIRMRSFADEFIRQFQDQEAGETADFTSRMGVVNLEGLTNEQILEHGFGVLEHLRTKSYVNFVKAARLGFYYSQRLQDLLEKRLNLEKDGAQQMYSKLNQGLDGSLITEANIAIAQAGSENEALGLAGQLVGHFNTGEMLEIRHKPLRDEPEALLAYVRGIRNSGDYKQQFERQKEARLEAQQGLLASLPESEREEMQAVLNASQTYMALRESIKYLFTKEYLVFRDALEGLSRRLRLADGDIYFVYPRELPDLAEDPDSMRHLISSRKNSYLNYKHLDLPKVIRESDIDSLGLKEGEDILFTHSKGKFLAEGPVVESGVVLNLDEFSNLDEARAALQNYRDQQLPVILVATQMNLSHDPFIAQSSGLIIENAGIVAHGAQRARELGKGAIGGVRAKMLKTGMKVAFDPLSKTIRKLD